MKILEANGFDHALAIKQLDIENIKVIESNTTENLQHILKDSVYEHNSTFKFLPGHKAAVLALPDLIVAYIVKANVSSNVNLNQRSAINYSNQENIDISTEEFKDNLVKTLIQKVEKYSKKIELNVSTLTDENISSIETCTSRAGATVYKCSVKCPICELKIPCIFDKNWKISNFEKHLKDFHANGKGVSKKSTAEKLTEGNSQNVGNGLENNSIIHRKSVIHLPKPSNEAEISVLLNSSDDNTSDSDVNQVVKQSPDKSAEKINSDIKSDVLYINLSESMAKLFAVEETQQKQN